MKRLSFFDLPAGPQPDPDGPSFWWALKFKAMHEQAVAGFTQVYKVKPIFHLAWPRHQVFLADPAKALVIDRATGRLADHGKRKLWEVNYCEARAFRPQDLAPQIPAILSGEASMESWVPMVMSEITVPDDTVEMFLTRLAAEGVFSLHWPDSGERHAFRLFGEPTLLESLRYQVSLDFVC